MIRVLIIDDSPIDRKILSFALNKHEDIEVIGTAKDAYMARNMILKMKPDVITLDIEMPGMDGLTFLSKLMKHFSMPVVVISSFAPTESKIALDALSLGATDVICKPGSDEDVQGVIDKIADHVRAAALSRKRSKRASSKRDNAKKYVRSESVKIPDVNKKVILIGSSTGGPGTLEQIFSKLPAGLPGILIVQHMPAAFTSSFAERLNRAGVVNVKEAEDGDILKPGHAYLAPGNRHMILEKRQSNYRIGVVYGEKKDNQRPSIDMLFQSVSEIHDISGTAMILTGMGHDGTLGMLKLKEKGFHTIAQDEDSSVVYGMPKSAFENGAVEEQVSLKNIPKKLTESFREKVLQ